ncbi:BON domain-containing protein [Aquabacterium sp.]|uniref:BON domain-containing protein n=1 Tax=Aquabacterium sp. TaxID=1872578 RepID=UPI0037844D3D
MVRSRGVTGAKGVLRLTGAMALLLAGAGLAQAQSRSNVFNDPFVQVTAALPACPVPDAPGVTPEEAKELAHDRAQRGVSCWLAGRCRLHNAYLYDAEIIPRVQKAIRVDGRYGNTSIWATGQRRWVWLQGCVATAEQSAEVEAMVRRIDDVEGVINQLMVGTAQLPAYRTAPK